jgi:hypothetical protein
MLDMLGRVTLEEIVGPSVPRKAAAQQGPIG